MRMRLARCWFVAGVLAVPLAGCEYAGPADTVTKSHAQPGSGQKPSFEENAGQVARLLQASADEPGLPTDEEPSGELSIVLAPGDYVVKGACAGVHGVKVSIVQGEKPPLTVPYTCDSVLERFIRHTGGPITVSAVAPVDKPAAAGVLLQPNTDPRASELEDLSQWAAQQLQPWLPGELGGYAGSSSAIGQGISADPGSYEVRFLCEGAPEAEFSVSSPAGAEVLAPVSVPCNGDVFRAPVELRTKGADLTMAPSNGVKSRYAFRLVPAP